MKKGKNNIRRVITLAGGICLYMPDFGALAIFGPRSAVELDNKDKKLTIIKFINT